MGFRFIKNKKEEEELINRGKQLSEQYERNRQQAQQQAQEQLKDYHFINNPNSWDEVLRATRHNYGENSQEFQNTLGRYYMQRYGTTNPTLKDRVKGEANQLMKNYTEAWTHPINFVKRTFGNREAQEIYDQRNESTWNKIQQQTEQFNNIANEWKQSETVGDAYNNTKRLLNVGLGIAKNYAGAENNTGIPLSDKTIEMLNNQKPIFDNQGMVANYRDKNINLPTQIDTSQNIKLPTKDLQEKRLEENEKDTVAQELIKKADINKSEEQLEGTELKSLARANELAEMMENGQTGSALLQRFGEDVTGRGGQTIKDIVSVVPMVVEGIARATGDEEAVQGLIDLRRDITRSRFNTAEIRSDLKSVREAQGKGGVGNDLLYVGSNVVDNMTGQITAGMLSGGAIVTNPATNYTTALMSVGAMGSAFNEREQKQGVSNQAYVKNAVASTLEGIWNGVLEKATGGTFATKKKITEVENSGWLDKLVFNQLAKRGIVNTKNMALVNGIWKYAGEVVEEVGTDLFTAITNQIAGEKFSDNFNYNKEKETIMYTLLTTALMNRLGMGGIDTEQFAKQYNVTEEDIKKLKTITDAVLDENGLSETEAKEKLTNKLDEKGIDVNNLDKTIETVNQSENNKASLLTMAKNLNISEEAKSLIRDIATDDGIITKQDYDNVVSKIKDILKTDTEIQQAQMLQDTSIEYDNLENQKKSLDDIKPENYTDKEHKRYYATIGNQPRINQDILNTVLNAYPPNRNGRRTVKTWKNVARNLGEQLAVNGKDFNETRQTVVQAFQDLISKDTISKYDSESKKTVGFDKLNKNTWSKEAYEGYKNAMRFNIQQQQDNMYDNLNNQMLDMQDKINVLINTIDDYTVDTTELDRQELRQNLVESAEKNGYKGKSLDEIQALMEKRGIKSRFDKNAFVLKDSKGYVITDEQGNPKYDTKTGAFYDPDNNEIVFNPNASEEQIIQELAVHEWYHELKQNNTEEATKIQEDIINYLKRNNQYADIRKNLEKTYIEQGYDKNRPDFTDMIDEEATAKALQQVLGSEEEIQRLANYNRNWARRIYDAVVNLLNKFTGGRNEKLFWTNVRNNFERVFNTPGTANENNQSNNQKRLSTNTESSEKSSINLPEVKEGYTRLYRGLESEYNNNYDKSKLDNVNGYESWTDDYDLAKAYGDNVYYIDVPTSEIKNSILDEDANSETYGDRNLIYKNDKPVGIKGKNGNEYMLYTDHDNYKDIQYNKVNQAPTTDNQNITITNKDKYKTEPKEGTIRLYTNTSANNIDSILRDGLLVSKAKQKEYEGKMTWFETRPDLKGYGGTTIAVDVPSNISMEKLNGTQYGIYEDISPENIVFIDKPIFNTLRTSDLQNYSDKYGKNKVLEVYDKALDNNKYISREELVSLLDTIDSNTSNQPTTDNQGRELSKQQQEFFKDSQARDENGNLIEMYHGTNENFTVFDKNGKGKRFTNFGTEYDTDVKGFFFTSNKSYAEEFGNVKPYYLNTKKILKLDNNIDDLNKIFQPMLEDMLNNQDITKTQYDAIIENGTTYKRFIDEDGIDWDIIDEEVFNDSIKIMKELGYDSIAVNEGNDNTSIMVFNSNQIKNVDNTNPTENPDIRYSVSTSGEMQDNNGNKVTIDGTEYEVKGKEVSPYQRNISKEWDIDSIQNQLKKEQSPSVPARAELDKFDNLDEMKDNIYYHGSIGFNRNLKAGSTLREDQRTGGYGEAYHTISLSKNRNLASNFASMGSEGVVSPVLLRKDARVIKMDNISDSIELEEYLPELWQNNIDAVELGEGSEEELVVLNPKAITVLEKGRTDFRNYGKPKFQNLNTEDLESLYQNYKTDEIVDLKEKINNETDETKRKILEKELDTLQRKSIQDIGTDNASFDPNTIMTHEQLREFKDQVEDEINKKYGDNAVRIYISGLPSGFNVEVDNKLNGENVKQHLDTTDSRELFKQIRPLLSELTKEAGFDVENVINSSKQTTDNQGRELSKGQQEYFKDSKVRDENGNLIVMNHATPDNTFTVFGKKNQGKNSAKYFKQKGGLGEGFYFSDEEMAYKIWNDWVEQETKKPAKSMKVYLDIKNPFYVTDTKIDEDIKSYINEKGIKSEKMKTNRDVIYFASLNDINIQDMMKNLGYDGIIERDTNNIYQAVAFSPNQIKSVDNLNPTEDEDIRYSKNTQDYDSWIKENLPKLGNKKTKLSDLKVPTKKQANLPVQKQEIRSSIETIPEENTDNLPVSSLKANQKQRKAYKSIIESEFTSKEAKQIAYDYLNSDTYVPDSNKEQLERADKRIERNGIENELASLETNVNEGKKITAEDIAVGDRLIKYYMTTGDKANLERSIRAMAMAGTQAGRTVQAFAMIRHQSPEGMAIWIQNSVDKLNSNLKGKQQFEFTPEMQEKILNSNSENLQQNVDEVMKELGQQVPVDFLGKLDAWRYFSMLGNPKTHIRNIVGNFAMAQTQKVKSKIAGTIEQVTGQDRTHTSLFERRNRKAIEFAKQDFQNADVKALLGIGTSKYTNPKNMIQQNQRTFKSDLLEKTLGRLFNINDKLLEAEDNFGLKNAYIRNLSDYMTANKLTVENMTGEQLQQARKMAVEESLRATFHQASALATTLNQIEQKNLFSKVAMGGLVPFKKTPINVAKTGFTYSPVGLAKTILSDTVKLRQGKINVNEYIDNLSQGLTGTGIALLGYGLAEAGILKAGGDDDKEDKYKEAMGDQPYAITINGNSYSLDWLAPAGIPLFVGAELNKLVKDRASQGEDESDTINELERVSRLFDASATLLNPMSEMSMISGLTSTLQTFATDPGQGLMNLGINPIKSYVSQIAPTSLGQIARSTDEYERDTSSTAKGMIAKAVDSTKNQVMNKIPGLRQKLPTKKDIWGEEVKTQDYFHNAVLPYTKKEVKTNAVDKELNALYEKTGENIYPTTSLSKDVTYEGSKTRLTNKDYNEFKEAYGKNSYRILNSLVNSSEYKGMTDEQKVKAIKDVYTYANDLNKTNYANKKGISFETPTDVQQVNAIKQNGGSEADYFKYKGMVQGLSKDSEKMTTLKNSKLSTNSKTAIYESILGKDDDFYQSTDNLLNINEYLDYKGANLTSDKDENGKTISGSLKNKKADYINNNISGYENRLLLMAKDYKLNRQQQEDLLGYINMQSNAEDIFNLLDKNYTVKNGRVYYK